VRLVAGEAPVSVVLAQQGVPEGQQRVVRQAAGVDGAQVLLQLLQALQQADRGTCAHNTVNMIKTLGYRSETDAE
jgi:hypothetical protein